MKAVIEELRNCPFCGSEPAVKSYKVQGRIRRFIKCHNESCGATMTISGMAQLVKAWNRRQSHQEPPPYLDMISTKTLMDELKRRGRAAFEGLPEANEATP